MQYKNQFSYLRADSNIYSFQIVFSSAAPYLLACEWYQEEGAQFESEGLRTSIELSAVLSCVNHLVGIKQAIKKNPIYMYICLFFSGVNLIIVMIQLKITASC